MGKIIDIAEELRKENPAARVIDLRIYADALRTYREAAKNIAENGAICSHPRTGTPIENPYLKVSVSAGAVLAKMRTVKSDRVIKLLDARK